MITITTTTALECHLAAFKRNVLNRHKLSPFRIQKRERKDA